LTDKQRVGFTIASRTMTFKVFSMVMSLMNTKINYVL
jgi:hypothetical protein